MIRTNNYKIVIIFLSLLLLMAHGVEADITFSSPSSDGQRLTEIPVNLSANVFLPNTNLTHITYVITYPEASARSNKYEYDHHASTSYSNLTGLPLTPNLASNNQSGGVYNTTWTPTVSEAPDENYVFTIYIANITTPTIETKNISFGLNLHPPKVSEVLPKNGTGNEGAGIKFSARVSDFFGIDSVDFKLFNSSGNVTQWLTARTASSDKTNATWTAALPNLDAAGISEGPYNVSIRANDTDGKNVSANFSQIEVDKTKPVIHKPTGPSGFTDPRPGNHSPHRSGASGSLEVNLKVSDANAVKSVKIRLNKLNGNAMGPLTDAVLISGTHLDGLWGSNINVTNLNEADYYYYAEATDKALNTQKINLTSTAFFLDKTLPTAQLISPSAGIFRGNILLNASVTDNSVKSVAFNLVSDSGESGWKSATYLGEYIDKRSGNWELSYDSTLTDDGTYVINLNATDTAMNSFIFQTPYNVTIDNTPPTIEHLKPANSANLGRFVNLSVNVSDATSGVQAVRFMLLNTNNDSINSSWLSAALTEGNRSKGNWTYKFDTRLLHSGEYKLKVNATDKAGGSHQSENTGIKIDNDAPEVSIKQPDNGTIFAANGTTVVKVQANDTSGVQSLRVRFIGTTQGAWVDATRESGTANSGVWTATMNISNLNDGLHDIYVEAKDSSSITKTFAETVAQIRIDTQKPNAPSVTSPSEKLLRGDVLINISASDAQGVKNVEFKFEKAGESNPWKNTSFGSGTVMSGHWNATFDTSTVEDENYTLKVRVTDHADQVRSSFTNFIIDNTAPAVSAHTLPADMYGASYSVKFNTTVYDLNGVNSVRFRLVNLTESKSTGWQSATRDNNNETNSTWSAVLNTNELADGGVYEAQIEATDKTGNKLENAVLASGIFVDRIKPQVELRSPQDNEQQSHDVIIEARVTELGGAGISYLQFRLTNSSGNQTVWKNATYNDDPSNALWTTTIDVRTLEPGTYLIEVKAVDRSNNTYTEKQRRVRVTPFTTINVNPSHDIQSKINNAQNGDALIFSPGTYRSPFTVNKNLVLKSNDRSNTIFKFDNTTSYNGSIDAGIIVANYSGKVVIEGLTFDFSEMPKKSNLSSGTTSGILFVGSAGTQAKISNNVMRGMGNSSDNVQEERTIRIKQTGSNASNLTTFEISNNQLTNAGHIGILAEGLLTASIHNNVITESNNDFAHGIELNGGASASIVNNTISGLSRSGSKKGSGIRYFPSIRTVGSFGDVEAFAKIENNTITNSEIGMAIGSLECWALDGTEVKTLASIVNNNVSNNNHTGVRISSCVAGKGANANEYEDLNANLTGNIIKNNLQYGVFMSNDNSIGNFFGHATVNLKNNTITESSTLLEKHVYFGTGGGSLHGTFNATYNYFGPNLGYLAALDLISTGITYYPWYVDSSLQNPTTNRFFMLTPENRSSTSSDTVQIKMAAEKGGDVKNVTFRIHNSSHETSWANATNYNNPRTASLWSATVDASSLGEGIYKIAASVTDSKDSTITKTIEDIGEIAINKNPPVAVFQSPSNGSTVKNTITLRATVSDPGGVKSVIFRVVGPEASSNPLSATLSEGTETSGTWSAEFNTKLLGNGVYNVTAEARDRSDNKADTLRSQIKIVNGPTPPEDGSCSDTIVGNCTSGFPNEVPDTPTQYKWECLGISGGRTVQCQLPIPQIVNGACNNAIRDNCTAGQFSDTNDTSTHYKWECLGANGGSKDSCQMEIPPPVNGACNNAIKDNCTVGQFNDTNDTSTHYKWECLGANGGSKDSCQMEIPPPVNGACNNAIKDNCTVGQFNDTNDTLTHYKWECLGANGGSKDSCQKPKPPVNGACNNAIRDNCTAGQFSNTSDTSTHYKWECLGTNGGSKDSCQKPKPPVNGACNNATKNGCTVGQLNDTNDTSTHYKWECLGTNGGSKDSCQKPKPPVNGACNNAIRDNCTAGQFSDTNDTSTHYKWECLGTNGGSKDSCQKPILQPPPPLTPQPVNGVCGSEVDTCTAGETVDTDDNLTHYLWECRGLKGGETAHCQDPKPVIHGACSPEVDICAAGNSTDINDSLTHYRWQCVGSNGGSTDTCQNPKPPTHGVCDNPRKNKCIAGQFNELVDTSTHYKWECRGINGGGTDPCQKLIPQPPYMSPSQPENGVCGLGVDTCAAGENVDISDSSTHYRWECRGRNGGRTAPQCQIPIPTQQRVDGACGTTVDVCTGGSTLEPRDDSSTHAKWACVGVNGGRTVPCELEIINGSCHDTVVDDCTGGTLRHQVDSSTHYRWQCVGSNGGSTDTCQIPIPPQRVDGACSTTVDACTRGDPRQQDDNSTHYKWECVGSNGGSTDTCQNPKPPTHGVCNNATKNECIAGTRNDITDSSTHYKWECRGINGGRTSQCQKLIPQPPYMSPSQPENGVCGLGVDTCAAGENVDISDSSTHYRWECRGRNGGRTAPQCQIPIPTQQRVDGACGTTVDACTGGSHVQRDDSSTHAKWACVGVNGGRTVPCELEIINGSCHDTVVDDCTGGTLQQRDDSSTHYRWQCVGSNGGGIAQCQIPIPPQRVDGACSTTVDACTRGDPRQQDDNSTHYKWQCVGSNGGSTDTCQNPKPAIHGVCDNTRKSICTAGNFNELIDNSTHYRWECGGINGGGTDQCQKLIPQPPLPSPAQPENGACGSEVDTCTAGENVDISDSSTHYRWECRGINGGSNAPQCQIPIPPQQRVDGACGTTVDVCTGGSTLQQKDDNSTHYRWQCVGSNGGETAQCQSLIPTPRVDGACGTTVDACTGGRFLQQDDTSTRLKWQCVGSNGGENISCELEIINGACHNTVVDDCTGGTLQQKDDSSTHYRWQCVGSHGGGIAQCQIPIPPQRVDGACGTTVDACTRGDPRQQDDSSTQYKWECVGSNGGETAQCQNPKPPTHGVCDNPRKNECIAGTRNDITDSSTHYKWECRGINGGRTSQCQKLIPQPPLPSPAQQVNGVCSLKVDTCTAGRNADIPDNSTHYRWECRGRNGGSNAPQCQSLIPTRRVDGACGKTVDGCTEDSKLQQQDDNSTHYRWQCAGVNGGETAQCQSLIPTQPTQQRVDGACGKTVDGCTGGEPRQQVDNSTHYRWQCAGVNGGETAQCQSLIPTQQRVDGACHNTVVDRCTGGSKLQQQVDNSTHYRWQCAGVNGGETAQCQSLIPTRRVDGVCGQTVDACTGGSHVQRDDSSTHVKWGCAGVNGGRTVPCELRIINGACHDTVVDRCTGGTLRQQDDSSTHVKWQCIGANGGKTAQCQIPIPSVVQMGVCGSGKYKCDVGYYASRPETSTHYKWYCDGMRGGGRVSCSLLKSESGRASEKELLLSAPVPESECSSPGSSTFIYATVSNKGRQTLEDVKIITRVPELDVHAESGPFDVRFGRPVSRVMHFDVPASAAQGQYYAQVEATSEGDSIIKYGSFEVSPICR